MSWRQNLLNRISWALFKRETVGYDVKGNKYYRLLDKSVDGELIERRMVKYAGDWDPAQVPPEWLQWLRKTRSDPPTKVDISEGDAARHEFRQQADAADAAAAEAAMRHQQRSGTPESFTQQLGNKEPSPK